MLTFQVFVSFVLVVAIHIPFVDTVGIRSRMGIGTHSELYRQFVVYLDLDDNPILPVGIDATLFQKNTKKRRRRRTDWK
jgi:hypothetical protein